MGRRVVDVGNCDPDHSMIKRLLEQHFAAEVVRAHSRDGALTELRQQPFDLVLVNRLMDADGSPGMQLIESIQHDKSLSAVPVLMITNFPDHQQAAIAAGAVPGFGKAALGDPQTLTLLSTHLDGV